VTEITGELARGLADLNSPALARTMQSIYHNRQPSNLPRWKNSAWIRFVSSTVSCVSDAVFNQDRMIYESNAFTEHCGCRL
jgi:uncharacterized membrane protein